MYFYVYEREERNTAMSSWIMAQTTHVLNKTFILTHRARGQETASDVPDVLCQRHSSVPFTVWSWRSQVPIS